MTYTEILELIRAGYTRAEIDAMQKEETPAPVSAAADPGPAIEVEPDEEQKQTTTQNKPESVPPAEPAKHEQTEVEKLVSALGLKLDALTRAVQTSNTQTIEGSTPAETAQDILARIINPKMEG